METKEIVEKIHSLLYTNLLLQSPVLSGSMKSKISENGLDIIIDAPFYNLKQWEKTGAIIYTGKTINGRTAYAEWVNRLGGFATHNKSEGWVNRAVVEVAETIANEIGAVVINELRL